MRHEQQLIISVIGASKAEPEIALTAEQVGTELAKRDAIVVCGGIGGVMEAVCRGAKSAGGTTIGILPGSDPTDANPWVDIPICTGMGFARNTIVVMTGRAVIAVGGSYGTLTEIGYARVNNIPVIGLNTWQIATTMDGPDKSILLADDATDAVDKALKVIEWHGIRSRFR